MRVHIVWAGPFAQESVHATVHLPHRQVPEPPQSASTAHEVSQRGGSAFFEDEQEAQANANKPAPKSKPPSHANQTNPAFGRTLTSKCSFHKPHSSGFRIPFQMEAGGGDPSAAKRRLSALDNVPVLRLNRYVNGTYEQVCHYLPCIRPPLPLASWVWKGRLVGKA